MLYVTSRKVLGLLSNWREPLILSYMSCEISGNFKFSCGFVVFKGVVSAWAAKHIFDCMIHLWIHSFI